MIFYSPLEQFKILPLFLVNVLGFEILITNISILLGLILFYLFSLFLFSLSSKDFTFFVVPSRIQIVIESLYSFLLSLTIDNLNSLKSQKFFPLIFSVFFFVAFSNLLGLVPYSFTVTSHFATTLCISLTLFIGINIICGIVYKFQYFALFLPSGTPLLLSFLLVPVEFVLYFFRPLSLAIRLFCNMMAGHTLLKIFVGFSWTLMGSKGAFFFLHYIPLFTLFPLFLLETAVALIQAFVFSLLCCIYLNDALNLH